MGHLRENTTKANSGNMEILVPLGRKSSLTLRNAFNTLAELEIARTQWTNRELCSKYMRQFIDMDTKKHLYYGVVINKNNLSVCAVDGKGRRFVVISIIMSRKMHCF